MIDSVTARAFESTTSVAELKRAVKRTFPGAISCDASQLALFRVKHSDGKRLDAVLRNYDQIMANSLSRAVQDKFMRHGDDAALDPNMPIVE